MLYENFKLFEKIFENWSFLIMDNYSEINKNIILISNKVLSPSNDEIITCKDSSSSTTQKSDYRFVELMHSSLRSEAKIKLNLDFF